MKTLNRVLIVGNVGKDPEMQITPREKKFLPVSVATSTTFAPKDGEPTTHTEWHSVMFWGDALADLAHNMLHKGTPVLVEGKLRTYKKFDPVNDVDRYNTVIVAQNFIVLNKKQDIGEPTQREIAEADVPF